MANLLDAVEASASVRRVPIVNGLWDAGEVLGIHALPEQYKTFLMLNLAEALALGGEFLGFRVPAPLKVYLFEADMPLDEFHVRLLQMNKARRLPWANLRGVTQEQLRQFRRTPLLETKFDLLVTLLAAEQPDVVLLDSTNQFFRGGADPNDERVVGSFFDRMNLLPVRAVGFIRHDKKPGKFDSPEPTAQRIRGSGVWADSSDVLLSPHRKDRRTQQVTVAITKLRNRQAPDNPQLWLDRQTLRLQLDPIEAIRREHPGEILSRTRLLAELEQRFSISQKPADDLLKGAGIPFSLRGHERVYELPIVPVASLAELEPTEAATA